MKLKSTTARVMALAAESPPMNMAIDQAVLESVDRDPVPTLRLYTWSEPTLSLGYFQSISDRQLHPESHSLAVVRRATGGGAIVHHHELTYSFVWPLKKSSTGARSELYRETHLAIVETLANFGIKASRFADRPTDRLTDQLADQGAKTKEPFLCFRRRTNEDLIVNGYKIVGSAQRTARRTVLQHGSVLLSVSAHAPQLPGVHELLGKKISVEEVANVFSEKIADRFAVQFEPYSLDSHTMEASRAIAANRFANANWTQKR
ncbi:Octanoyltransferase LipM [Novipirellula aureliae]|uniref:Octanoyltransferase LipM n=1 Tax=Novipirellula aureliae TaxID=2527966 RepID=A0A5C6E6U8_9BACT|nr:biotin/lipoate A/B protein ligase family protein [Novipirellula aureliae]TWU43186.1 Octanoyltransferase LipM [Novipirellula aureliae]